MSKCLDAGQRSVLVMIRFYNGRFHACKNSLVSKMSIINSYNGRVLGLASQIKCDSKSWDDHDWLAFLDFYTEIEATRFIDGCPDIRQFDWLDGVDIVILTDTFQIDISKKWISISYDDSQKSNCSTNICPDQVSSVLEKYGGNLIALPNVKINNNRGLWNINNGFIAQWECDQEFQKMQDDAELKCLNGTTILLCKIVQLGDIKGKFNEIDY